MTSSRLHSQCGKAQGLRQILLASPTQAAFLFLTWVAKERSRVAHGEHPDPGPLLTLLPLAVPVWAAFFTSLASESSSVKWGTDVELL